VSPRLIQALDIEIPAQKRLCKEQAETLGTKLLQFALSQEHTPAKTKMRLKPMTLTHPEWQQIESHIPHSQAELSRLVHMVQGALLGFEEFKETPLYAKLTPHLFELNSVLRKLERWALFLERFNGHEEKRACWIECSPSNVSLVNATLDVSSV